MSWVSEGGCQMVYPLGLWLSEVGKALIAHG